MAGIEINSVWNAVGLDGFAVGLWRVIAICPYTRLAVMYHLTEERELERPRAIELEELTKAIAKTRAEPAFFPLPKFQLCSDDRLTVRQKETRDQRLAKIAGPVSDRQLPVKLALHARVNDLRAHAERVSISRKTLSRLMALYWTYGMRPNALLPAFHRRGAPGQIREPGKRKRGRPRSFRTLAFVAREGVNVDSRHRKLLLDALKKNYLKEKPQTLKKIVEDLGEEHFPEHLMAAEVAGHEPDVPRYEALLYWKRLLLKTSQITKAQTSRREWLLNNRALLSHASANTPFPGSCFEIDATPADPYLVAPFNRNHVIGRPIVYAITDRASRMIVALYIGWEHEGWAAARQALMNCVSYKRAYCLRFNVDISEHDWPCHHLGQTIVSDRGGIISKAAVGATSPHVTIEFTGTNRADMKSIVERRFGIFKEDVFDHTPGTTGGKPTKRRQRDPRIDAKYTLDEFTEILIREVLEHNNVRQFDDLALSSLLLENDAAPTPRNFWSLHREHQLHALRTVSENDARAMFLQPVEASVTRSGFEYNGLNYSCDEAAAQGWFETARSSGRWRVEARADLENTEIFFVKAGPESPLWECQLHPKHKLLAKRHIGEVHYFRDWKKHKSEVASGFAASTENATRLAELSKAADKAKKASPPNQSKAERTAGMKDRRRREAERIKVSKQSTAASNTSDNVVQLPRIVTTREQRAEEALRRLVYNNGSDDES